MKYFRKIAGQPDIGRVYLSPLNPDDYALYTRWLNEPEVMDNIGGNYYNNNIISCRNWFEEKLKDDRSVLFAIVLVQSDTPIGYFEFTELDHIHRTGSFCVFIAGDENRGKGYGTEAVRLAVRYGFDVLNLRNIDLKVYAFNERAQKSYEKAGFREYGRRTGAYYLRGEYHDVVYMEILCESCKNH
jgi:RimJ/RimL family protein N-acetyltransferase